MEFSSLKGQRSNAHDEAEARAAAAAASAEMDDSASQTRPSSSKPRRTRTSPASNSNSRFEQTTPAQDPLVATPAAETPFGQAMASPDAASAAADEPHSQPLEDGSLPQPGLGSAEHTAFSSGSVYRPDSPEDAAEQPMKPHNLLTATQLIQAGGDPLSPFAPAPILRLNAIRIAGANRALRPSYLASLCRPYMDPTLSTQNPDASYLNALYYGSRTSHVLPGQPTTLPSILALTSSLAGDLDKLDIFRNIKASLAPSIFPGANEEDVDVILSCGKPKGRVFLKSSTDVGNGEGSASVQGRIRNVFGGAETLQGSATFGTRTKQAFNLEFGGPFAGNPDIEYKLSAFSHDRDYSAFALVSEGVKGVRASINSSFTSEPKGVINPSEEDAGQTASTSQHELAYEASLRELGRVMADASVAVRKMAAAPSIKSAVSWTWLSENRDSPVLPSRGRKLKSVLEYAGLGGDAKHVKVEVEGTTGRHFSPLEWLFPSSSTTSASSPSPFLEEAKETSTLPSTTDATPALFSPYYPLYTSLTFRSGLLYPLRSSSCSYTHFSDRFQLGGPTCLRMFRHSSLGPKSDHSSLGGDAFYSLGLSCLSPIPTKPHWPLMLHTFINAGQLCQLPTQPWKDQGKYWGALKELAQPSSSVGVGLVYMQGQLRVELNAGVPLSARKGDGVRKGLQLGIGIDFL
ncbi:related to SAM50-essential component of the SAM or TOB complex of the mitochondrial outer membrane [Ustilago bromivora]|uniref:Related to SAM50 - essential component of the SAM or TOB complex of the mitochondrial outer membrane n=1 Tax=Ustilago bromivora TaxID=307758 RepID=A0A1K0H7M2_9BASI|nr:related to SAM50-essential component of the SAM or TOB complex of the mitochondrial outer membrane [Ustilago bromivora]SYW79813.1 related to SAM50 - essential component of the SAM or TOB complex of the mitochondrial outer membrane [Ustilago bromivora]